MGTLWANPLRMTLWLRWCRRCTTLLILSGIKLTEAYNILLNARLAEITMPTQCPNCFQQCLTPTLTQSSRYFFNLLIFLRPPAFPTLHPFPNSPYPPKIHLPRLSIGPRLCFPLALRVFGLTLQPRSTAIVPSRKPCFAGTWESHKQIIWPRNSTELLDC